MIIALPLLKMNSFGWSDFWKEEKQSFDDVMRIGTTFFAIQFEKLFQLKASDEIFDYGCGPAFVGEHLLKKKIAITGADINPSYINQNQKNQPASLFITITTDAESNKKILDEQLKTKKFDFIILLSIVQYFKNHQELADVIGMLVPYLKSNGKLILADIVDGGTSPVKDAVSLLRQCIKNAKVIAFFKFIFYLLSSNYRQLSKHNKLLKVSEQTIQQIASKNSLSYKKINGLTIHSSRTSYVLSKISDL